MRNEIKHHTALSHRQDLSPGSHFAPCIEEILKSKLQVLDVWRGAEILRLNSVISSSQMSISDLTPFLTEEGMKMCWTGLELKMTNGLGNFKKKLESVKDSMSLRLKKSIYKPWKWQAN